MGFVERAEVTGDGSVEIDFRLPTYWCSPNFAFLMLDGVRKALDQLSWAPAYRVKLHDHMFAEEVNRGMDGGQDLRRHLRRACRGSGSRRAARNLRDEGLQAAPGGGAAAACGSTA